MQAFKWKVIRPLRRTAGRILRAAGLRGKPLPAFVPYAESAVRRPLVFGPHPDVPEERMDIHSPWLLAAQERLERCRSFPYDLKVFNRMEPETEYLPYITDPSMDSLDIGANIGLYSAYLSPLSRFVYAWEANRRIVPFLQTTLSAYDNCIVLPLAVGTVAGVLPFNIPVTSGDPLYNSGSGGLQKQLMDHLNVPTYTMEVPLMGIDSMRLDRVGMMKIDVEGNELDVLHCAAETIDRCRPSVIVENEYRHNPECMKVFEFLQSRNYTGYFVPRNTRKLMPFSAFDLKRDQLDLLDKQYNLMKPEAYVFSFMFVPAEKDRLRARL